MKNLFVLSLIFLSSLALASDGGHGAAHHETGIPKVVFYQFLNLGVLLVALIYFTKDKVAGIFQQRRADFDALLNESQKHLNEAEGKKNDITGRLTKLKQTAAQDLVNAKLESEKEHAHKMSEAQETILKINKDVEGHITAEAQKNFEKLRIEHFGAAKEMAEKNLQTKSVNTIRNSFSERMKGAQS